MPESSTSPAGEESDVAFDFLVQTGSDSASPKLSTAGASRRSVMLQELRGVVQRRGRVRRMRLLGVAAGLALVGFFVLQSLRRPTDGQTNLPRDIASPGPGRLGPAIAQTTRNASPTIEVVRGSQAFKFTRLAPLRCEASATYAVRTILDDDLASWLGSAGHAPGYCRVDGRVHVFDVDDAAQRRGAD